MYYCFYMNLSYESPINRVSSNDIYIFIQNIISQRNFTFNSKKNIMIVLSYFIYDVLIL